MSWRSVRGKLNGRGGVTLEVFEHSYYTAKRRLVQVTVPAKELVSELTKLGVMPEPEKILIPADDQAVLQNEILLYNQLDSVPLTTYGKRVKKLLWERITRKMRLPNS